MTHRGSSLLEMLIALAISSVLLLSATRVFPLLQRNNLRTLMQFQLQEEMQLMMGSIEKSVLRAGYCKDSCVGEALRIQADGHCLLVRWDETSNRRDERDARTDRDLYGYRWRDGSLETQRDVDSCDGGGWEHLNDPKTVIVEDFRAARHARQIRLFMTVSAKVFPSLRLSLERWLTPVNL